MAVQEPFIIRIQIVHFHNVNIEDKVLEVGNKYYISITEQRLVKVIGKRNN